LKPLKNASRLSEIQIQVEDPGYSWENNLEVIILSFILCNGYKSIKKLGRKMGKIISD
jgi:hypothetical protein